MQNQMNENYYKQILKEKKRLGPIHWFYPRSTDICIAHYLLGKEVRSQVNKTLTSKLDRKDHHELSKLFEHTNICHDILFELINSSKANNRIGQLIKLYYKCLRNWAIGAGLDRFENDKLNQINNGKKFSPVILALFLQNEVNGCQTGVYRDSTNSILLWHTEEDAENETENHFDKLRIFAFKNQFTKPAAEVYSFIYPHLLPGPAYAWNSNGYIQAIDSIYVKPSIKEKGLYSNIITWLTLFSGGDLPIKEIVISLSPFLDGNAITFVKNENGKFKAEKIEFAGDRFLHSSLDEEIGSYLFQVNVFSKRKSELKSNYEIHDKSIIDFMNARIDRTVNVIKSLKKTPYSIKKGINDLITSFREGDSGYANTYVKSYLLAHADTKSINLLIGKGSATKNDTPTHIHLIPEKSLKACWQQSRGKTKRTSVKL